MGVVFGMGSIILVELGHGQGRLSMCGGILSVLLKVAEVRVLGGFIAFIR